MWHFARQNICSFSLWIVGVGSVPFTPTIQNIFPTKTMSCGKRKIDVQTLTLRPIKHNSGIQVHASPTQPMVKLKSIFPVKFYEQKFKYVSDQLTLQTNEGIY